jgi:hypothetical protein
VLLSADRSAGFADGVEVSHERVSQASRAGIAGKRNGGRQIDAEITEERGHGHMACASSIAVVRFSAAWFSKPVDDWLLLSR